MGRFIQRWRQSEEGVAALEAALVFPILILLLMATYDMGNAIVTDQKVIRASQVTGDLITRGRTVNSSDLTEAIYAGKLAMVPEPTGSYGIDIVSIRFDDNADPVIVWRETQNMEPNPTVLDSIASLAEAGSGVVVTTVQYNFHPLFGNYVFGTIPMQEMAFTRGRKSSVVNRV